MCPASPPPPLSPALPQLCFSLTIDPQSIEVNSPSFRFCKAIAIRLPRMPNLIAVSEVSIKLCFESEGGKKAVLAHATFNARTLIDAAKMDAPVDDAALERGELGGGGMPAPARTEPGAFGFSGKVRRRGPVAGAGRRGSGAFMSCPCDPSQTVAALLALH